MPIVEMDPLDMPWQCALCGTWVTDRTLHLHACCACGWRDRAQDGKPDWACPHCN